MYQLKDSIKKLKVNMKKLNLQSTTIEDKLTEFYILFLFGLFPLFLIKETIFQCAVRSFVFYIITVFLGICYFVLTMKNKKILRKPKGMADVLLFGLAFYSLDILLFSFIQGKKDYEYVLVFLGLICLFYLISCGISLYLYLLDVFLVSASIICGMLFVRYFVNAGFVKPIELLLTNGEQITSFLVLTSTTAVLKYCFTENKGAKWWYGFLGGMSFLLLFVNYNIAGIFIVGLLFLLIPVLFIPTAELIKRDMQMFFLYFFLLSNMSLLTNYTNVINKVLQFPFINSVYIDLFLAVVGVAFFCYWEKVPENMDLSRLTLYKLQGVYRRILSAVILGMLILPSVLPNFSVWEFTSNGAFYEILEHYGVVGLFIVLVWIVTVAQEIREKRIETGENSILTIFAVMFFLQSLFLEVQTITTPIYVVFLAMTLYGKEV